MRISTTARWRPGEYSPAQFTSIKRSRRRLPVMTLVIRTRDLRKDYGDVQALDGFDLDVDQGEFYAYVTNNAGTPTPIDA